MIVYLEDGYKIVAEINNKKRELTDLNNRVGVSTITGMMLQPRLYFDGGIEGILEGDKNDVRFEPERDSDKEWIITRLIHKYTITVEEIFEYGDNVVDVDLPDLVAYGKWVIGRKQNIYSYNMLLDLPLPIINDLLHGDDTYMLDMEAYMTDFEPAFLVLYETLLAYRLIHKDIWNAIQERDAKALQEIEWGNVSLADLIVPLHYRVIKDNVDGWVFKNLSRAVASSYLLSLRMLSKVPEKVGVERRDNTIGALLAKEDFALIKLLSMYVKDKGRFWSIVEQGIDVGKNLNHTLGLDLNDPGFYALYKKWSKYMSSGGVQK